jgi:hypothetical protein
MFYSIVMMIYRKFYDFWIFGFLDEVDDVKSLLYGM